MAQLPRRRPDTFCLLPDFKDTAGQVIRQIVTWALHV